MFELNYPRFEEKKENLFCSAECGLDYISAQEQTNYLDTRRYGCE